MTTTDVHFIEKRIHRIGMGLIAVGTVVSWWVWGGRGSLSFLGGGLLGAVNLRWLQAGVSGMFTGDPKRSKHRVLWGFLLRLLLIPLTLYAMIRFLFLNVPAAVAGLAVFSCSIFIEGLLEALGKTADKNARTQ